MSNDPLIEAITPRTDWYVVLRPFAGDERYIRGEVVDVSGWRHINTLVEHRYVVPLPHGVDVPTAGDDGRRIISLDEQQEQVVPAKKRPVPTRK